MNILFFLKPKASLDYLYSDYTLRQALEQMEEHKYQVVPIIDRNGDYYGSISAADILFAIKKEPNFDIKVAEKKKLIEIDRTRSYQAINVNKDINELIRVSLEQNFVPVVDDRNKFIGIVTRKDIIVSFLKKNVNDDGGTKWKLQ